MDSLKEQLKKYVDDCLVENLRKKMKLVSGTKRPVIILKGNPGTGKTSISYVIADILYKCNIVDKPTLFVATRPDLVAMHIGETPRMTRDIIDKARGATLLVDEAYQLSVIGSADDLGCEAVETLMGTIEGGPITGDDRPAYIFAGYPEEMDRFIEINPGLKRRITDVFLFKDYDENELAQIRQEVDDYVKIQTINIDVNHR